MENFDAEVSATAPAKNKTPGWVWALVGCLGCGGLSVVVLGILMAIALPSFLNQANKAKESEAKHYVGAMIRGQQAYFLENNKFASSIDDLEIGLSSTSTKNYAYNLEADNQTGGVPYSVITAVPQASSANSTLHSFLGVVVTTSKGKEATTIAILCRSLRPSSQAPELPKFDPKAAAPLTCSPGSTQL
jgi:type IV pilus assembly protein PilA